jgi:hypothetical protein
MFLCACLAIPVAAEVRSLRVDSSGQILINDQPTRLWGFRAACAATKDESTKQLIASIKELKQSGCNLLFVNYQGGAGLSARTFAADGQSFEDPAARERVRQIADAAAANDVLVAVTLFFPRRSGIGGHDPRLASRAAYLAACRTAADELMVRRNVLICVADQPVAGAFGACAMKFTAPDVVECLNVIASAAPNTPRGGGSSAHAANLTIARAPAATVVFHAEAGVAPPAFPGVTKPIVHTGFVGTDAGRNPQGLYPPAARQPFTDLLDRHADAPTAHLTVHFPAWTEGGVEQQRNRFDLGGQGTAKDPGIAWYFDALRKRVMRPVAGAPNPGAPAEPGKSIFE